MAIKLIGFVGLPGAGKGTALEAVQHLGPTFVMGDIVREELAKRGIPYTSDNLGALSKQLRQEFGENVVAMKIIEKIKEFEKTIKNNEKKVVFVDGLRSDKEYHYFKQNYPMKIIFLECPEQIRYQRLAVRGRADDSTDFREAKKRDEREIGFGLLNIRDMADYIVDAAQSAEAMKKQCLEIVLKIINED